MKKQVVVLLVLVTAASSLLTAGPVESSKDVAPSQTQPAESPWSFSLTPYGWMSGIDGTFSVGNRTADVDISFQDVLTHLDMSIMMAAELRYKRWGFMGDFIYARLSNDFDPPAGIVFSSTHIVVKETIGTFALSYRVVDSKPVFLDLFAGGRVYDYYGQIRLNPNRGNRGVNVSASETWADPIIGLRGRYFFSRAVFVNLYGDVGGFGLGSDISWQLLGALGVQVSRWCDLEVGYRAVNFDHETERTKQDLTTHGPIIGATFHF